MFRRWWQMAMIALARSGPVTRFIQDTRATSSLASQYVAGRTPAEGVARARTLLEADRIRSSLFYMGEYVDRLDLVEENLRNQMAIAEKLAEAGLDIHVSADPTQIGHHIDPALVDERAEKLARTIGGLARGREGVNCLMLDMEDQTLIDPTIGLHARLRHKGLPVALTLQAYLRRTEADLVEEIARGSRVRLVKGAFAAGVDIAFASRREIKANSRRLIDLMFSPRARTSGFYPIIATHDTALHAHAITTAEVNGWPKGSYEFEMLLGVREDVAKDLAARGERVRLYVPFGQNWWPHAVRRIGENPSNAVLLARSLIG